MSFVVFRADGGPSIGSGHVMRCLALATVFAENGWRIGFAVSAETVATVAALGRSGLEVFTLPDQAGDEPGALAARWPDGVDVLIADHYARDAKFERACRPWARRILVVDDLADRPHDADILTDGVNTEAAYAGLVPAECKILGGKEYAIIHPRFSMERERALARRDGRPVGRILVSLGQIDAPNATMMALAALRAAGFDGDVDVALGAAAPHLQAVMSAANARTRVHVNAENMAALMADADLAIGAGGVSAWERCCLGLPSLIVTLADNQLRQVEIIVREGAGVSVGWAGAVLAERIPEALLSLLADGDKRRSMAQAAARLVNGAGPARIFAAVT